MRLEVNAERDTNDSVVKLETGGPVSLHIPSGAQSGLKLVSGLDIGEDESADFAIDFDLRKSVHRPEGTHPDYVLRPALRLVDATESGLLRGRVEQALLHDDADAACPPLEEPQDGAVYVFEEGGVAPDDVDGTPPEPITSAQVELDEGSGFYEYVVGFLEPGEYTAALTCRASDDDADEDDDIPFVETHDVTIAQGETTERDFGNP